MLKEYTFKENRQVAAIYCRVSTQEQALNGYSLSAQKEVCRKLAQDRSWLHRLYQDPGFTASNTNRPGFKDMIQDTILGKFSAIIVYRLDRLSRSISDFAPFFDFLQEYKIDIISVSEPHLDTTTPWGKHNVYQMILYAQLEREIFRERSILGQRARFKEGKWKGGTTPLGYRYDRESEKLVIDNDEASVVRLIFKKYLEYQGLKRVAFYLDRNNIPTRNGKKWAATTIRNVLKREAYIGILKLGNIEKCLEEIKIIDHDIFKEVNKILEERSKYAPQKKKEYSMYCGKEYCYQCGSILLHEMSLCFECGTPKKIAI